MVDRTLLVEDDGDCGGGDACVQRFAGSIRH